MTILTIAEADALSQEWVDANVDFERAMAVYEALHHTKWQEFVDWKADYEWAWENIMGDIFALVELPLIKARPSESDQAIEFNHGPTSPATELYRQGHTPPPLRLIQHVDGHLVNLTPHFWLAARNAGLEKMLAWYSPTTDYGRPKWQRRLCTWDHDIICTHRRAGGDCTDCPQRPEQWRTS